MKSALRWGLIAWLALQLIVTAAAFYSINYVPAGVTVPVPGYEPPETHAFFEAWLRADALWYLKIAKHGYGDSLATFAFFPAFPLATRVVGFFMPSELVAGLVVASGAILAGFVFLHRWIEMASTSAAARAGVVGLALFPTSFFLIAPYGECMLLAAGSGALLAAASGRFKLAGVAGAVAALSRPFGIFMVIPLLAYAYRARGRGRWLAPAGPIAGALAWGAFAALRTGDPLAAINVQSIWQRSPTFFGATLIRSFTVPFEFANSSLLPYLLFDLVALLFGIVLVVLVRRGLKDRLTGWAMALYGAAILLLVLSTPFAPRPAMAVPRFVLALFPLFAVYGRLPLSRRALRVFLAAMSGAGLFVATVVFIAARPLF